MNTTIKVVTGQHTRASFFQLRSIAKSVRSARSYLFANRIQLDPICSDRIS